MLPDQRLLRPSFCSRRGAKISQAAIIAKMPANVANRIRSSLATSASDIGRYHLSRSAPAQARHAKASGDTLRCRSRCRCNAQKMWPAVRKQVRQTGATIATIN
jgi:hypothetical protein